MASHILNALTLRHDHDAAERTLDHFWHTRDLFDSSLIEEHLGSQPLLAASLFSLLACSLGLVIFAVVFLTCRLRGQCGAQKYQEYPSNSTNYAVYLMLFFISWLIVTSASAYFVLAGSAFWSEKLDGPKVIPNLETSRHSRSAIGDLFSNYDYHGDFENVSESPRDSLKRIHIRRQPLQTFRKKIEIPFRPMAEMQFTGSSDKFIAKHRNVKEEEETVSNAPITTEPTPQRDEKNLEDLLNANDLSDSTEASASSTEVEEDVLVVTGESMRVEEGASESSEHENEYESSVEEPKTTEPVTTTTMIVTTSMEPKTTSQLFREQEDVLDQLLSASTETTLTYNPNVVYFSLHSRLLIFICRLAFCLVALMLIVIVLPTFFLVVAGTGCYIYSDHPMTRSSVSNKIGKAVSINASILLFASPCLLVFSSFALFYTHSHELLCAAIQLQHQKANGVLDENRQSLLETYSMNSSQCSRSLAPVQSLLLSSLLVAVSLLPCVFALFKLVKFYFRMSSEFYWNAADNFAGRQFSKQQEFPRYQSTVIYPDDEGGYAVYGQI